jgi:hypothetical protein
MIKTFRTPPKSGGFAASLGYILRVLVPVLQSQVKSISFENALHKALLAKGKPDNFNKSR